MALLIRGANLIDGTGVDPVKTATVSIANAVFDEVGGDIKAVKGADTLDLDGLTILPGLIDAHSHLGIVDVGLGDRTAPAVLAAQIFANCGLALDGGFTTVRDVGGIDGGVASTV